MTTATPDTIDPAIAQAARFLVNDPPRMIDLLINALQRDGVNPRGQITLVLEDHQDFDTAFSPITAEMHLPPVELDDIQGEYAVPLRLKHYRDAPSQFGVLHYPGSPSDLQPAVVFAPLFLNAFPAFVKEPADEVQKLVYRSEFFEELRSELSFFSGAEEALLGATQLFVTGGVTNEDFEVAKGLVKKHFDTP